MLTFFVDRMSSSQQAWQRARRPEQKELRRSEILAAAAKLLDAEGIEGTGLNAIGRATGMSKPNLYRYFESREAILLQLLLDEHAVWSRDFRKKLKPLRGCGDVDRVAKAFANSISRRANFCVLIGALATVLEHNVGADTVREFKRQLHKENLKVSASFCSALPSLTEGDAYSIGAMMLMAASGMWPHCHPAAVVAEVLEDPEFAPLKFDFEQTVRAHTALLLRGYLAG